MEILVIYHWAHGETGYFPIQQLKLLNQRKYMIQVLSRFFTDIKNLKNKKYWEKLSISFFLLFFKNENFY